MIFWKTKRGKSPDCDAATEARERSEKRLAETRRDWRKVREVTNSLERIRRANHFAELLEKAMRHSP